MVAEPESSSSWRVPLTRDRVLRAAIQIADEEGLDALTMCRLGQELGVQAMSLATTSRTRTTCTRASSTWR